MAANSLSSVVSNLVRAQMGSAVSDQVSDTDLDRHVAELILKEAKQKALKYKEQGIAAYLDRTRNSDAPRANKRFLSSIIRSTDDHNRTILRAQAEAAEEIRREKEEVERKERRARAEEAAEAECLRRSGTRGEREHGRDRHGKRRERSWDRRRDREEDDGAKWERERDRKRRARRREEGREREDGGHRRSSQKERDWRDEFLSEDKDVEDRGEDKVHRKERRRKRSRSRGREEEEDDDIGPSTSRSHPPKDEARRSRRRSPHSPSRDHSPRPRKARHRSRSPGDRGTRHSSNRADVAKQRPRRSPSPAVVPQPPTSSPPPPPPPSDPPPLPKSAAKKAELVRPSRPPTPSASAASSRTLRSRTPSPGPPSLQLDPSRPSKMDKYFESSYDPRLDVAPLSAPHVPATGLIDDAQFAGWDAMLDLLRQRREDKEERRRLERLGLVDKEGKPKNEKKAKGPGWGEGIEERFSGAAGAEQDLMSVVYTKRGGTREWDMGKNMSF